MKTIELISEAHNHTAGHLGPFDALAEYTYNHPVLKVDGKVFISEVLKTTGAEISFQTLPPQAAMPFFHRHRQNEEIYVFLKGSGAFQIDDACFDVGEGTLVRVAPEGRRSWRNTGDEPLVFMVIQVKHGTLEHFGVSDGMLVPEKA